MRKIYLSLTGGLGNQLFQIAAAMAVAGGEKVVVEWVNSRPRLNSQGYSEISDFMLPENVVFLNAHKFQKLNSKSIGYLLRMGIKPRVYEKTKFYQQVASFLVSLINITSLGRYARVVLNRGVGYFPAVATKTNDSIHLIGYFQTYRWITELENHQSYLNMKVKVPSKELIALTELASLEDPLVVHMRFGDYRSEESFGLLTPEYYLKSIRELWISGNYKSIWVFSDEIAEAKNYLRDIEIVNVRYISDVGNSSSQTLEAMRLGKGFVIGNSSFSWWAARLSLNTGAPVIAPIPWFLGQDEPKDLIPPHWLRRKGHKI